MKWHEQTKSETGGAYNKPDYGEAVYSGDGKPSYTFSNQGFSLSQNRARAGQYDHKGEQTSTISPYNQMDHAWTSGEFDVSNEVDWANETIKVHDGPAYNHNGIYTQRMTCSSGRSVWSCGQCS